MSPRQNQRARAINRINARSKYFDRLGGSSALPRSRFTTSHREPHLRPGRLPNPVALHGDDPLWPSALQQFQIVQQLLRVRGSLQKPLLDLARFHQSIFMPPAIPVHNLLVGQHCAALRAPVNAAFFLVSEPALQHAQKKPLVPPVIFRLARGNFPPPVKAEPKAPQHSLKFRNVVVSPGSRVSIVLYRRVFSRQTKSVPSHRMQHVESAHALHPRHYIANRVVAHVPHVHRARGIRQHFQHVVFWLRRICLRLEDPRICPAFLPFCFDRLWVVFRHSQLSPLPNYPLFRFPLAPRTFFAFFAGTVRFAVTRFAAFAKRFALAARFAVATGFVVATPFVGFVAIAAPLAPLPPPPTPVAITLAPLPPPATPVIPTEAGR